MGNNKHNFPLNSFFFAKETGFGVSVDSTALALIWNSSKILMKQNTNMYCLVSDSEVLVDYNPRGLVTSIIFLLRGKNS